MTSLENAITGNVIVYQAENESVSTNVLFKDETFWMTQKDMAKLFDVNILFVDTTYTPFEVVIYILSAMYIS